MITIDEQAAVDAIMSARHSDAFNRGACVKILRDAISGTTKALRDALERSHNRLLYVKVYDKGFFDDWQEIIDQNLEALGLGTPSVQSSKATPDYRLKGRYVCENDGGVIFECNSKVDAEVALATVNELKNANDNLFKVSRKHCVENQQLKSELAAERKRHEVTLDELADCKKQYRAKCQQHLSALAALKPFATIAKELLTNRKQLGVTTDDDFINAAAVDLSALHQHVAEARKPLVDALEAVRDARNFGHAYDIAQGALTKVKP